MTVTMTMTMTKNKIQNRSFKGPLKEKYLSDHGAYVGFPIISFFNHDRAFYDCILTSKDFNDKSENFRVTARWISYVSTYRIIFFPISFPEVTLTRNMPKNGSNTLASELH